MASSPDFAEKVNAKGCRVSHFHSIVKTSCPLARRSRYPGGRNQGPYRVPSDSFTLWRDADPDIPILKQAKLEYSKLQ
jgi:hypothetical protein